MPFNPNTPCKLGLEWIPATEPSQIIGGAPARRGRQINDGYPPVGAAYLTSAATETIDKAHLFLSFADAPDSGFEVEVYDADDLPAAATTTTSFVPTADVTAIDSYGYDNGTQSTPGSGSLFALINNATPVAGTYGTYGRKLYDDSFLFPIFGAGMEYACRFGSVVGALTGEAITNVQLAARVAELVDTRLIASATFTPYLEIGGERFFGPTQTVTGAGRQGYTDLVASWPANPSTGCSWRVADVEQFDDTNTGASAGWVVGATGSANNLPIIFYATLDVTTVAAEKRVAVGCLTPTPGALSGWYTAELAHPDGTDNWAKASGTNYLIVLRRRTGNGFVKWRYLSSGTIRPGSDLAGGNDDLSLEGPPNYARADLQMVAGTGFPSRVRSTNSRQAYALILETTAPATSTDSQPYASVGDDIAPKKGVTDYWTRVDAAQTVEQEVTTDGSGGTYGTVVFMAAVADAENPPADSLYVRLLNGAGVQQGDTLEVTVDELSFPRDLFRTLIRRLPGTAPTLAAATQYRIEFASPGSTSAQGWRVQVASTGDPAGINGPPSDSGLATFGGTTDTARINGVGYDYLDAACYLMTIPSHTFNLTATQVQVNGDACVTGAQLGWDQSSLAGCGGFLRYEIQRRDDVDYVWRDVARITTETVEQWTDVECRRGGVRTEWRIRVVRADLSPSDWTDNVALNVTSPCGGITLATNQDTTKAVHYADVGGRRRWAFPDGDKTVRQMMNSNYAVAYGGLEFDGDRFRLDLLVLGLGMAAGLTEAVEDQPGRNVGIQAFDALRILASQMPETSTGQKFTPAYVAVVDDSGGRWLASIAVTDAAREAVDGEGHIAEVEVVEVTNTPTVVDAS